MRPEHAKGTCGGDRRREKEEVTHNILETGDDRTQANAGQQESGGNEQWGRNEGKSHILSMMEVLDEALDEEQDMMQTSMKPEQESGG